MPNAVESLVTGANRLSQTLKARVVSPRAPDERLVVVKICQDSLGKVDWFLPPPSPEELSQLETAPMPGDWKPLWYKAANEAAAYEHLEVLQGSVLPWFFGVFL
jgi:hypothetical protein